MQDSQRPSTKTFVQINLLLQNLKSYYDNIFNYFPIDKDSIVNQTSDEKFFDQYFIIYNIKQQIQDEIQGCNSSIQQILQIMNNMIINKETYYEYFEEVIKQKNLNISIEQFSSIDFSSYLEEFSFRFNQIVSSVEALRDINSAISQQSQMA